MSRAEKRLAAIRANPDDVRFDDLCSAVERVGFVLAKGEGSHRVYRHSGPPAEMLTLQPRQDGKAKPYQVKQFIAALDRLFPEMES